MIKPTLVISCPATSRSGYGDHARDLIRSLINMEKFSITIKDQRWGDCPQDALTEADRDIFDLISPGPVQTQPDIWVQITVPNEFQPIGKYNIGITAGVESTLCSKEFIDGCNRMDWILVPSNFTKEVLLNTRFDKMDNGTKVDEVKCTTKIDVLFEGLDLEIYNKTKDIPVTIAKSMEDVKNDFCFLIVGHWMNGDYRHDRKDIGGTIHTIMDSFKNKSKKNMPAIVLKSSSATFSIMDRESILEKVRQIQASFNQENLPDVYLLHGDLTQDEMNGLYNHPKNKVMVSFTHGEGFGRPLLEFSVTGKPVICSGFSGHLDFMKEYGIILPGSLEPVHNTVLVKDIIIPESKWFYVDCEKASAIIKDVHKNYKRYLEHSRKSTQYVKDNFSIEKMDSDFEKLLDETIPPIYRGIVPELPKLEEIKDE